MQIKDIMTSNPACASKNSSLQEVAQMMDDCDCGMIPVIEQNGRKQVLGTITDRDIVIRCIANGKNPLQGTASDVMSSNPVTVNQNASESEAEDLMSQHQIRRLIVVDDNNDCVGVLAQADLARSESEENVGRVVEQISKPSGKQPSGRA